VRRVVTAVGLIACGGSPAAGSTAGAAPPSAPVRRPVDDVLPAPERPLPFTLPEGASKLSSSSLDGTRSVSLAVQGDEASAAAWTRTTLRGLGCRDLVESRPWEELELRCRDGSGASAVVAQVGDRVTVVVSWMDVPDRLDVAE
jgi:hypothetical protein